ncbi:hypothetical protein FOA52_013309 [Chlamydomonas sp. UWO 241]|nr:hypothetical protein FOA52_013309 [Chlamydomonas sp. UWO 241]
MRESTDGGDSIIAASSVPFHRAHFEGLRVLAYVNQQPVCKQALHLARVMLQGRCSELTLAYCAPNPYSYEGMLGVLEEYAEPFEAAGFVVKTELFSKNDEHQTVVEAMVEYVNTTVPDLVILGSTSLCNDAKMEEDLASKNRKTYVGVPDSWIRASAKPSHQAFAVKLAQQMRSTPLLIVKADSKGSLFSAPAHAAAAPDSPPQTLSPSGSIGPVRSGIPDERARPPLRWMADLQSTSRHLLDWAFNLVVPGRDTLHLVVSKAYDTVGATKQTAVRMITAFSVQASVAKIKAQRNLFKDSAEKALPPAVEEERIDILMVQGPRSRELSPYIIKLLCSAKTAVLIWPPEVDSHALGQRASPADSQEGEQAASLARDLQTRASINASMTGRSASSFSHDGSVASEMPQQRVSDTGPVMGTAAAAAAAAGAGAAGARALRSSASLPSQRQRAFGSYGGQGLPGSGRYAYGGETPRVDTVTEAAMAAMHARMARKKEQEEVQMSGAINAQRRGAML